MRQTHPLLFSLTTLASIVVLRRQVNAWRRRTRLNVNDNGVLVPSRCDEVSMEGVAAQRK